MPERPARRSRVVTLIRALVVAACATIAGLAYEQFGTWRDGLAARRVGSGVDIGGRTLNLHCAGTGSPTVVFDSGRTQPGYVWTPVQRQVAAFTRACWYDRAGLGWSDPGPDPSWGDSAARDLHGLLGAAHLPPPYVMVGASFGGYVARLYHATYPGETHGFVFVDPALEDAGTIEGLPHRDPPRIPRWLARGLSVAMGSVGMVRVMTPASDPTPDGWAPDEWDLLHRLRRQRGALLADAQHGPEDATARLMRHTGGLDHVPMVVLTQGREPQDSDSVEARVRREWIALQRSFAERSTRGRQIVVRNSGHGIAIAAPHAVVAAVRSAAGEVRADEHSGVRE